MNPWTSNLLQLFAEVFIMLSTQSLNVKKMFWVRGVEQNNLNSFNVFQAWDPIISLLKGIMMFIQNYKVCPINKFWKNKV